MTKTNGAPEGRRCHPMVTRHGEKRPLEGGGDGDGGSSKRPSGPSSTEDDEPRCWICFDGPSESGELTRDCSCRGSSGYAHISCIDEWARRSVEDWDCDEPYALTWPWTVCNQCRQFHQNEVAVDLAKKMVTYAEENYRDEPLVHLGALRMQLFILSEQTLSGNRSPKCLRGTPDRGGREAEQRQREEIIRKGNSILSTIERLKEETGSLSDDMLGIESDVCNVIGRCFHSDLTDESARRAVSYFERCVFVSKVIEDEECIAIAEGNIAMAKSVYEDVDKWAGEMEEKCRTVYNLRDAEAGPNASDTLETGVELALCLHNANRVLEAERLATKTFRTCVQVHGHGYNVTIEAEKTLQLCKERHVNIASRGSERFRILRYEDDETKCVVRGPVAAPRHSPAISSFVDTIANEEEMETFIVDSKDVRPTLGTPVICHGLKESHLNGKIGDLQTRDGVTTRSGATGFFNVHFEDPDIEPRPVEHRCMRILFDLPGE